MKFINHFDTFLKDVVNLNQTRIDTLETRVNAIETFLEESSYIAKITGFSTQGSWSHKTIIKPLPNKEFDADLVMYVNRHNDWEPKDYVNELYYIFQNSERYKDKVNRGTRCVTLDYSADFHLDIIPCITSHSSITNQLTFEVCNRIKNDFERTDSKAYTAWITERNQWTQNNMLRYTTRLIKYLRDYKQTFSAKSILLTTLIGNQVRITDKFLAKEYFPDLPTSLKTLVNRLNIYLQQYPKMPEIINPILPQEHFNRHWNEEKYENFRECINRYSNWVDDAYDEENRNESIRKWRKIFGEDFAKSAVIEAACFSFSDRSVGQPKGDLFFQNQIPFDLPHIESLPWRFNNKLSVNIHAREYMERNSSSHIRILGSGEPISKERWIRFEARLKNNSPPSLDNFEVHWQVVK